MASLPINSFIEVNKPGSALLDLIECKIQLLPQRRHHSRDLMTRLCGNQMRMKNNADRTRELKHIMDSSYCEREK